MNRRKTEAMLIAGLAMGVSVSPAVAGPITWEFAGEITNVLDGDNLLGGAVTVGIPFSGSFTFESTTPDSDPDPTRGFYEGAVPVLNGMLGDIPFSIDGLTDIEVLNDFGVTSPRDWYAVDGSVELLGESMGFFIHLNDPTASIFTSDSLPLHPPILDPLNVRTFGIFSQPAGVVVNGEVTLLVPEPGTLCMLAIGTAMFMRRRRRVKRRSSLRTSSIMLLSVLSLLAGFTSGSSSANAQEVCGCMDMVLVIDVTGSMEGSRDKLRLDLRDIVENTAMPTSGGDLRLGFITFGEVVTVQHTLTTNINAVLTTLDNFDGELGGDQPEPSDQAVCEMLGGPCGCTPGVFDSVPFRAQCIKHAILITDDLPSGCDGDVFDCPVDKDFSFDLADEAAEQGITMSTILVRSGGINCDPPIVDEPCSFIPEERQACIIMNFYAGKTRGVFATVPSNGDGIKASLQPIIGSCPDCNGNLINDLCEISCAAAPGCVQPCGGGSDSPPNGVPDECDCGGRPDPPTTPAGEAGFAKNRVISVLPGNAGLNTGIRLTLTQADSCLFPDCPNCSTCTNCLTAPTSSEDNGGSANHSRSARMPATVLVKRLLTADPVRDCHRNGFGRQGWSVIQPAPILRIGRRSSTFAPFPVRRVIRRIRYVPREPAAWTASFTSSTGRFFQLLSYPTTMRPYMTCK